MLAGMKPLPNFDDPEWDAKRIALQDELARVAESLIDHMGGPAGVRGSFEFDMVDGRILKVVLETGERPKPN